MSADEQVLTTPTESMDTELNAFDIFNADDLGGCMQKVQIPEWPKNGVPGTLWLRPMSALATLEMRSSRKTDEERADTMVVLVAESACDSKGNLLFTKVQVERLKLKNTAVFARLQDKILRMNGMLREEKSWEALLPILQGAGVPADVIRKVELAWSTPLDVVKKR